jgi:UDP-glucuronate decarboxylase
MQKPDLAGEVINIGSKDEITIKELAKTVISVVDSDSEITYEPLPHADDPQRRQPDISRAKSRLGWNPTVSLEEGLEQVVASLKKQI